jgi:hypothetical protein
MSRDSSVGIATGYGLDNQDSLKLEAGIDRLALRHTEGQGFRQGQETFLQSTVTVHPASYPISTEAPFSIGKVAGV